MSEDTISRQAAIDICNNAIDLWHGQLGEGIVIAVKKKIKALPSAQPETPMQIGWICPICGRGLSPLTSVCPCNNGKGWEITC